MPSFDVVSTVDLQEVRNAVQQAKKEVGNRYDFKGSDPSIELKEKEWEIVLEVSDSMKLEAMREILKQRLAKRGVDLKSCVFEEEKKVGGDRVAQRVRIKQGLAEDEQKRIVKAIKGMKLKVSSQIQGNQVRVAGKKKDDLQKVIGMLKSEASDLALQFVNFRD
ncbi:MAG: YajQ family cyclic di-GMP-binding protein [Candidatus Dadabacteria bacterium]|nr:MAG: YajQ family cyclic di-GMP-binding protein [Candidatus Dadabacteria bacterium]